MNNMLKVVALCMIAFIIYVVVYLTLRSMLCFGLGVWC